MRTLTLSLAALAGCSTALATPAPDELAATTTSATAAARARGPAALAELLARYDALPPGTAREALALAIDEVAAQRYATVARLYWYTDLGEAEAAARARHVPILSLRMLGDLRVDLSCANSRLFRSTLYANREVSAYLREHFVLHWSSERPVPRVTIDFGDGRTLERTTTGNSAHFILDERGRVLDVLPGLYAPVAFRRELAASLALAARVRPLDDAARATAIVAYQSAVAQASNAWLARLSGMQILGGVRRLLTAADLGSALALAQRATMSKARIEVPDLAQFGLSPGSLDPTDVAGWAMAGQIVYGIGDLVAPDAAAAPNAVPQAAAPPAPPPHVLDAASRALVEQLHDAGPASLRATPVQLAAVLDRLEQSIVADTAQNQLRLRPAIARHIAQTGATESFDTLDAWIYAQVFQTPRDDAWLGLLPRTDFSGLPGDGVVMR